ncbi:transporter substrate-binding domain-containing protein [Bartonella tamiae]|uniref:Lysine-arginine-ornithine-binding periplasmic protein n=1 Tax=Bartonella tamiae Th239 TaxID=1094558 RepID=J0QTT6_9HYPH|nr:transporter substrate-binding domain-containing protein [Bartonella tamiae]EJF89321.1 hypothetical protein ME5_01872 [Bartonella tamiae Th239]EJF95517.1 hypothetical protein MEG_00007 [Bartonella tamiae Th307]
MGGKKSVIFATLLLYIITGANTYGQNFVFATEGNYPPFEYVDSNNNLQGFDVEIARALCEQLKFNCSIVIQDWEGIIPGLLAHKYDAIIASMGPTEERLKKVDFTNPYYRTRLAIAVRKESDIKTLNIDELVGKSIGALAGSVQALYAEDHLWPQGVNMRFYPNADDANTDLTIGRTDAVIHDNFPLLDWLENDGKDCCRLLGFLEKTESPISIAIRKNEGDLKAKLNQAILDIRKNGTYQKISQKYFGQDIY